MKRWLILVVVVIVVVTSAILARKAWYASQEKQIQAALLMYSRNLRPGLTRKDVEEYLRARHADFYTGNSFGKEGGWADYVKVGERPPPLTCGVMPAWVTLEFTAMDPEGVPSGHMKRPDGLDILTRVHLTVGSNDCL